MNWSDSPVASGFTTTVFEAPPTANMQACGGLMIAEKLLTPNIPKLETVKVPPESSSGLSLPSRALPAISLTEVEMSSKPKRLVLLNTGAMRPWSVWTAKDMLTFLYYLMYSIIQELLVSGTLIAAMDAALMTKSLTESLVEDTLFNLALSFMRLSTCMEYET